MSDNVISIDDGRIEVYLTRIRELADEYLTQLPEDRTLTEPETFSGLIGYLYRNLFRPRKDQKGKSVLDYDNLDLLDSIWTEYTALCGRYKQTPSLFEYCTLTGISPDTLTDWSSGKIRGKDDARIRTIKRWKNYCVSALEKKAVGGNSVGAIFALKAAHGWRETSPLPVEETQAIQHDSPETIAERHKYAQLPEKPEL